ncbi:MAG: AbrB/MazE/SpoVT family DNA-binding domain-containing protein [Clostridia bacterium]|jgi:antitoxin component of MazEF toxin-antitoxin module
MKLVIRKIQSKRTSLMVSLPVELLEKLNVSGGDYLVFDYKNDSIILKKLNLERK